MRILLAVIGLTATPHMCSHNTNQSQMQCNWAVLEIGMVMGGSLSSHRGRRKEYSGLLGTVTTMILLKSTFSSFLGYLLFNYLSLCPQLSCMHCDVNPPLLIQGMANDDAIIACSSLAKVGAANRKIL